MMLRFLLRLVVLAMCSVVVAGAFFFGYRWGDVRAVSDEAAGSTSGSTINAGSRKARRRPDCRKGGSRAARQSG